MSKSERLRAKWRLRVHKIERRHVNAACPGCGFVFTNGFSRLDGGAAGFVGQDETLTICTRCRRPLAVPNQEGPPLRVLTPTEIMLLSDADRQVIADLTELFDDYTEGWD